MTDNNKAHDITDDIELFSDDLEVEQLEDGVNPGFTTAFTGASVGCASCPAGSASSASSVSSQGG